MKITGYIRDKMPAVIAAIFSACIMEVFLSAFHVPAALGIFCGSVFLVCGIWVMLWDYGRKKKFYEELFLNLEQLDRKYLVLELLRKPDFLEGELLFQALYEADKSMVEHVKAYEQSSHAFKEYIEMWIHEIKRPLASLALMAHNEEQGLPDKYVRQIRRLDNLVDQVLYYVRAEHAEQDYLFRKTELKEIVKRVAVRNKDDLLGSGIALVVEHVGQTVITDAKWLEFILNQIVNNAVKYKDKEKECGLWIWADEDEECVALHIRDNGIGISQRDLKRIFEKTFTGENGRKTVKSTGMGLFIAKSLCDRLGHGITVSSVLGEYTEFVITFGKNAFYDV